MQVGGWGGWESWEIKGCMLCFGNSPFNKDNGLQREISGFSTKIWKLVTHACIHSVH